MSIFVENKKYFIRTVTFSYVGKLIEQDKKFLVFNSGSWIADTGRFYNALKSGQFEEIEPFVEDLIIAKGAIVDATIWNHDLPKDQK